MACGPSWKTPLSLPRKPFRLSLSLSLRPVLPWPLSLLWPLLRLLLPLSLSLSLSLSSPPCRLTGSQPSLARPSEPKET